MLRRYYVGSVRWLVRSQRPAAVALVFGALAAAGCRRSSAAEKVERATLSREESRQAQKVLTQYADIAHAAYADASRGARELERAIGTLVETPSGERLDAARAAWIAARRPYLQTEVYRFYGGPIDRVELAVNTWPIDENYVESGSAERPGIIENVQAYPVLDEQLLLAVNAKEGETSISTGYHVIEYLLWGKDNSLETPGLRSVSDYQPKQNALAQRRGHYLKLSAGLLVRHLEELTQAWAAGRVDNYRAEFLRMTPLSALALVVRGMGALSGPELAGERLTVAYETKDQENEHSCFSDTTHQDIVFNAIGIENLCTGRYQPAHGSGLQGVGLCDFVSASAPELGQRLRQQVAASVAAARTIPAPFDRAMQGEDAAPGRRALQTTIQSLLKQTETLSEVAARFDLRAPHVEKRARP